jgi:serine/threonine-protein kinase RIO1
MNGICPQVRAAPANLDRLAEVTVPAPVPVVATVNVWLVAPLTTSDERSLPAMTASAQHSTAMSTGTADPLPAATRDTLR